MQELQAHPQSFDLLKILAKALKIRVNMAAKVV